MIFQGAELTQTKAGLFSYLPYKKLEHLLEMIENGKRSMQLPRKKSLQTHEHINFNDFKYVTKLGEGHFGEVYLVKNSNLSNSFYAIKCLSKEDMKHEQM